MPSQSELKFSVCSSLGLYTALHPVQTRQRKPSIHLAAIRANFRKEAFSTILEWKEVPRGVSAGAGGRGRLFGTGGLGGRCLREVSLGAENLGVETVRDLFRHGFDLHVGLDPVEVGGKWVANGVRSCIRFGAPP